MESGNLPKTNLFSLLQPLLLEVPQAVNCCRGHVVVSSRRITPDLLVLLRHPGTPRASEKCMAGAFAVHQRPDTRQRDPGVLECYSQHRVAGPVRVSSGFDFSFVLSIVVDNHPHGRSRNHESRSAVSESGIVADIRVDSEIVRLRGVHLG